MNKNEMNKKFEEVKDNMRKSFEKANKACKAAVKEFKKDIN